MHNEVILACTDKGKDYNNCQSHSFLEKEGGSTPQIHIDR